MDPFSLNSEDRRGKNDDCFHKFQNVSIKTSVMIIGQNAGGRLDIQTLHLARCLTSRESGNQMSDVSSDKSNGVVFIPRPR